MSCARLTRAWFGFVGIALCTLATAAACGPKVGRRQTQVMERSGKVKVSAAELRALASDLADRFMSRIEQTADRIAGESSDRAVDRRALAFKIGGVPAVYTAAYRADPLAAFMDLWALAFQLRGYVDVGPGGPWFGPQQPFATDMARDLLASADRVAESIAAQPEHYQRARARVEAWAATHVIEPPMSSRPSYASSLAGMQGGERDAFIAIGEATDTIEHLSERLNTYAAQLPKLARWQAELLVLDLGGERDLESALGDLHQLGAVARRANAVLDDVPAITNEAMSQLSQLTTEQRRAVLDAVDAQRVLTLDYVTDAHRQTLEFVSSQRLATLAALQQERLATLAALRDERLLIAASLEEARVETLKEVDRIRIRTVDAGVVGLKDTLDYALWRVTAVLVVLMVLASALAVVGYRLTVGRARQAV